MQIIVKKYEHINSALPNWNTPRGVYVKNKDHYDRLCKEAGMVAVEDAGEVSQGKLKGYELSAKAKSIISAAQAGSRNGKVKLSDKTIDAMKSIGALGKKVPSYMKLPACYDKGGFTQ